MKEFIFFYSLYAEYIRHKKPPMFLHVGASWHDSEITFICIYVIRKNYSHAGTITSMADFMNEVIL